VPAYVFAEDVACERLGLAIVRHADPALQVTSRITSGFGKIRADVPKYRKLAQRAPVIVITDLDDRDCPVRMLETWKVAPSLGAKLAFRIAVRECESWILADAHGVGRHFGLSAAAVPSLPDELPEPKQAFLTLLRRKSKGRSAMLADMLPMSGSMSPVGLGYNLHLGRFIDESWSVERAVQRSPSLARAVRSIVVSVSNDDVG